VSSHPEDVVVDRGGVIVAGRRLGSKVGAQLPQACHKLTLKK